MPIFAVYIVPRATDVLYQVGASFLGYDVRTGTLSSPLLLREFDQTKLESWIGLARIFGFHATLGDAIEYSEDVVPEIRMRLEWIAKRIPPFTLVGGRFHDTFRNVPRTLAATFDSPDGMLQKLHYLTVTMINVLYSSSPFFDPHTGSYPEDDREYIIRYGVPHSRILDRFDLHFSFATSIPDRQAWESLRQAITDKTSLFCSEGHRVLKVDEIHLLERRSDGYFRILSTFPLLGE
jgi:hypothetical protein